MDNKPFTCYGKHAWCLQGHVKAAKVTSYSIKYIEGFPVQIVRNHYIETFDKRGNHLKTYEYDKNCVLTGEESYTYSQEGLLLEIVFTKNGKQTLRNVHKYNSIGKRECILSYGEDNHFRGKEVFVYDDNGNLTEHRWETENPIYCWKHTYSYDENGNRKKSESQTLNKAPLKDEKGNIIHTYPSRYRLETERRYDSSNRIIEQKIFDFYGERYIKNVIKYFYSHDNSIERIITLDRNGNVEEVKELYYDANHNIVRAITYKGESNDISSISEYNYLYYSYKELTGENLDKLFDDD